MAITAMESTALPEFFKAWLGFFGALGFFLYPVVLLVWNFVEGRAAGTASKGSGVIGEKAVDPRKLSAEKPSAEKRFGEHSTSKAETVLRHCAALCANHWAWPALDWACTRVTALRNALRYLCMAVTCTARIVVFALTLGPWFLKIGYAYSTSTRILKSVRFGDQPRNYLDIYLPASWCPSDTQDKKAPVVIAVMGGAWVIGYRLWSALLALRLAEAGVMVVAVDYRNFPGADFPEMIGDVDRAIGWVFANIDQFGGDPANVALIGQSAGAHLSIMALLKRCKAGAQVNGDSNKGDSAASRADCTKAAAAAWSPEQLRGFVGVSGVYDLPALETHLAKRGVYPFMRRACAGSSLAAFSPVHRLLDTEDSCAAERLPPIQLFHGAADTSAPAAGALRLERALRAAGAPSVALEVRSGMRHCEPVVEDPFTGGDLQVELVLPFVLGKKEMERRLASLPAPYPSPPKALVHAVSPVMPF